MTRRKNRNTTGQLSFLENYGKTAPAVPAVKEAVRQWREDNYKGATETTKTLLNYWFLTDHTHIPQKK